MASQCWAQERSVRPYRIIEKQDISVKALTKRLSDYNNAQLRALPMNIRKTYRIVVPSNVTKEELKALMKHLVKQVTKENSDIDEVAVYAYDREEDSDSAYTFGKMEWCPNGNWAGVTPRIASSNDRSSYQYVFNIKEKVGRLSTTDIPTKQEYAIYDTYYKALWAEEDLDEEIIKKRVAKKLGISEKKLQEIWIKVTAYNME